MTNRRSGCFLPVKRSPFSCLTGSCSSESWDDEDAGREQTEPVFFSRVFPGLDESERNFITMWLGNASSVTGCPNQAEYSTYRINAHVAQCFSMHPQIKTCQGQNWGTIHANQSLYYANVVVTEPSETSLDICTLHQRHKVYCQMCGGLVGQVTCFIFALSFKKETV